MNVTLGQYIEHKPFDDLSNHELYSILRLRSEVFVVEQECVYLDMDNKDQSSIHVMIKNQNKEVVACTRVLPRGISYENYCSIGRIVNHKSVRGMKMGKSIIQYSIDLCHKLYPNDPIKIGAQKYLLRYYNSLGFEDNGVDYLEDGIPHIEMIHNSK